MIQKKEKKTKTESKYFSFWYLIDRSQKKQEELRKEIDSVSGTAEAHLLYGEKTWGEYGLHSQLLKNLKALKCKRPTVIQERAVEAAFRGKEILGAAPTGSGKTLAFSVPLVDWLMKLEEEEEEEEEEEIEEEVEEEVEEEEKEEEEKEEEVKEEKESEKEEKRERLSRRVFIRKSLRSHLSNQANSTTDSISLSNITLTNV